MKKHPQKQIVLFEEKEVRRTWHDEQWYFSITDIVKILTDSNDVKQYIKKMRTRDNELSLNWGTICTPLQITSKDGKQRNENMAQIQGIFRIIQSIPSPKAEPIKLWLAKVGYERMQEMGDPEMGINRARENWAKHGRSKAWIQQRMMGQEIRNKLTDYWSENEVKKGEEFAILTNIIHQEWSDISVRDHKNIKGLKTQNLRDHMSDAELVFTALAELSTRQIAETMKTKGLDENKIPAIKGGKIAKDARVALETKTSKPVITGKNFLLAKKPKKKK